MNENNESSVEVTLASTFVRRLQEYIVKKGDLPLYFSVNGDDRIEACTLGFSSDNGEIVIAPESMTEVDENLGYTRQALREVCEDFLKLSQDMNNIVNAVNKSFPDLDDAVYTYKSYR